MNGTMTTNKHESNYSQPVQENPKLETNFRNKKN